jgi:hypothetical protein
LPPCGSNMRQYHAVCGIVNNTSPPCLSKPSALQIVDWQFKWWAVPTLQLWRVMVVGRCCPAARRFGGVVGSAHPTVVRVVGRPIVGWALPTKWQKFQYPSGGQYSKRSKSHETVQSIVGWASPTKWQKFQYTSGGHRHPTRDAKPSENGSVQLQKPGRHRFIQPGSADGGAHFNLPAAAYWAGSTYGVITSGLSSTA